MHLMIPFASALDPHFEGALRELELPNLSHLLGLLAPAGEVGDADETTPIPPHERFLAQARGITTTTHRWPPGACARPVTSPATPPGRCCARPSWARTWAAACCASGWASARRCWPASAWAC
ncbi:hypothetical protein [Mitsuaria sp. TWR114]|uniref:hypothetical protein n=1 Tax=Mitsuaria sp. TWR114 TaxID=2601731 RepID=UPI002107BE0B|nr:hypothetical protein [Mitsuaria sp. TWR114]